MTRIQHDFLNIISPPVYNIEQMEKIYCWLENVFLPHSSQGMVFSGCGSKTAVINRLEYIKRSLENDGGVTLGDKSRNIYFSFSNIAYPLGKSETNYCQLGLGIKRKTFSFSTKKWLTLISTLCEQVNAYWGGFMPGDDYYQINNILQRDRLFQAQAEGREDWNKETAEQIQQLLMNDKELNQLPNLDLSGYLYKVHDIRIVSDIRWINYWDKNICEYNDLSSLLSLCGNEEEIIRTASGACTWALTSKPWQMCNKNHRQRLVKAYKQFPNVGIRFNE